MPFAAGPTFTAAQKGFGPRVVKQLNPDSASWHIQIDNLQGYLRALEQLHPKHMRRAIKSMMTRVAAEQRKDMRRRIPIGPGVFNDGSPRGHLRQSIKTVVKYYANNETAFAAIGVESGKGRRLSDQGYAGWWHHEGTKPSSKPILPKKGRYLVFTKGGQRIFAKQVKHRGSKANPFVFDSMRTMRRQFTSIATQELQKAIAKQAAKAQQVGKR